MRRKQSGAAVVEFALALPMLLVLTFITTEFGRAMYQYNTIAKSVRDATRYLSIQVPNSKLAEARNLVVYGKTAVTDADQPLAIGLDTTQVVIPPWNTAVGSDPVITTVTVQVTGYTFTSLVPSVFGIDLGSYTFSTISATMRSHL